MENDEDKKNRVVNLFKENAKPKTPRPRKAAPTIQVGEISGDGNQVAGGDIHNTHYNTEKIDRRPKVTVVPGHEVITETQKRRLLDLRAEWIRLNDLARRKPLSFAAAQNAINKKAGVTSYHLIPLDKFKVVEKYVQQQIGRLNNTATARKMSPTWANDKKKAIQARCNERGLQDWRKDYMKKKFGKESMTELTDEDLQTLYEAVMNKK